MLGSVVGSMLAYKLWERKELNGRKTIGVEIWFDFTPRSFMLCLKEDSRVSKVCELV